MKIILTKHLELTPSLLIASGRQRACYQHPEYDNLCIKIHHADRGDRETLREVKYYNRLYRSKSPVTTISHYYGTQETNLGLGYVFQLIKDKSGTVSKTLDYYLKNNNSFLEHQKNIRFAYNAFKNDTFKESIVTMTLKTYNIVYQLGYKPHGQFFIIDNLGCANFIPIDYFSSKIAQATLKRRFADFEQRVFREYHIKLTNKQSS
ncbi:YrbL family protein [Providencia burhodogranariea]|uniref:PhoP regulatory network protein YrbL n=1 Tax=Providencia burhodogranariea DSM 19968 TaxID=1141662 RepID=K8WVJ8_9GAMM|nr:YrbL family protein [Providencia burhodogranariea]EKT63941.1 hypothetical protein OOA_03739 [Providencia burhodogranariea DSM 19968]